MWYTLLNYQPQLVSLAGFLKHQQYQIISILATFSRSKDWIKMPNSGPSRLFAVYSKTSKSDVPKVTSKHFKCHPGWQQLSGTPEPPPNKSQRNICGLFSGQPSTFFRRNPQKSHPHQKKKTSNKPNPSNPALALFFSPISRHHPTPNTKTKNLKNRASEQKVLETKML